MDSQAKRHTRFLRALNSTMRSLRVARTTPGFNLIDTLHGYVYARWPYWWIAVGIGGRAPTGFKKSLINFLYNFMARFPADTPQFDKNGIHPGNGLHLIPCRRETFADTYHGKVIRPRAAKNLISVKRNVRLTNLEKVIPYSAANNLILESPDRILALDCPCRVARAKPCFPLDVCLIVGEPFASFAAEHHAERSRWIDKKEAVDILIAEAERGHVHHAFFKEAFLGRFFAICNCCSCCCGAIQAQRNGLPMLASSGYVCSVDQTACSACGTCEEICQFKAIAVGEKHAEENTAACMGCGVCASHCPQHAISMQRDPTRSEPLEVDKLIQKQARCGADKNPRKG